MPVEMRTTPGAPYSAEAVTESTQTLPDGNRINRKSDDARLSRRRRPDPPRSDSESGAVESTFIVDPQTGTNYVFEQNVRETMTGPDTQDLRDHDGPPDMVQFKGNMAAFAGGDVLFESESSRETRLTPKPRADRAFMLSAPRPRRRHGRTGRA